MRALVFGLLFLVSCAVPSSAPNPQASNVTVSEEAPPANLKNLGWVWGEDGRGCGARGVKGTREAALEQLKNRAANMGATYVQLEHERGVRYSPGCPMGINRIKIAGRAFGP